MKAEQEIQRRIEALKEGYDRLKHMLDENGHRERAAMIDTLGWVLDNEG